MKTRIFSWLFRVVLAFGLFVTPSLDISAAAPTPPAEPTAQVAALPNPLNLISIPVTGKPPTADGVCAQAEYGSAAMYTFNDGGGTNNASVRLMHDANFLYVCMTAPSGAEKGRFASLYLDPQADGASYQFARENDYSLKTMINGGALSSWHGSGVGPAPDSYLPDATIGAGWSALATTTSGDQVEYKIALNTFNFSSCGAIFGMALYHHWFNTPSNDYGWPSNQWYDQPRTWQLVTLDGVTCPKSGEIAYVFRGDTLSAASFYNLLAGVGYNVTLIPLDNVLSYDFTAFNLTLIADDTGYLNDWGSGGAVSASQVSKITATSLGKPGGTPVMGLGEGGYAFFGKMGLFIGWPQGWHGPQDHVNRAATPAATTIFSGIATPNPIPYYAAGTNGVGIYLSAPPAGVFEIGLENPLNNHASLIMQGCRMLWGSSGNPLVMKDVGKNIFFNSIAYISAFQCAPPQTPPPACTMSIAKTANPVGGTTINTGTVITYTINYNLGADAACPSGKVVDVIPAGTLFVPGSATGGVGPAPDGTLTWSVTHSGSVSFSVTVTENVCTAGRSVTNTAELRPSVGAILTSTPVTHTVNCQVVSLPTDQPMYAESEFKIDPYPLVAGHNTYLSVRVRNLTALPQPVSVQFQTSPAVFGIGLNYSTTLGTATATVPASGDAEVGIRFNPTFSGIACIQAVVTATNGGTPLITQSCLDVVEVLQPGRTDTLSFLVRNNTGAAGTVSLVVDNTCPGWTATITTPASGQYVNLAAGATGSPNAVLSVTPPTGGLLGSGCHIDVQAWIGTKMIGGVRKIDIAPVHLPLRVIPPWEESEMTFSPDPLVLGQPAQLCIRLVNPLGTAQTVTVDFAVADFGAGIGFTPAASGTFNLPPNSVTTHCVNWTPATTGTLHRCILATLKQTGYRDQTSQRNVNAVRPTATSGSLIIPFTAGNPDLIRHALGFTPRLVGINPHWQPVIEPLGGGTLPTTIEPGARIALQVRFILIGLDPSVTTAPPPPMLDFSAGSRHSVEISVLLDGVETGGFTVEITPYPTYLPLTRK